MESNISKLKSVIFSSLFSLFLLIFIGCKKNEPLINSNISSDDFQSSVVGSVDNSVDSLAIVDYLDCGAISYGGDFEYDENGKIYYQYGSNRYTSDGKFVYESIDGGENGMIECGEEQIEFSSSKNCGTCDGSGKKMCLVCDGKGNFFCGNCGGRGLIGVNVCEKCDGRGTDGDYISGDIDCHYCNGGYSSCDMCKGTGIEE